jgi:hypothetical protein
MVTEEIQQGEEMSYYSDVHAVFYPTEIVDGKIPEDYATRLAKLKMWWLGHKDKQPEWVVTENWLKWIEGNGLKMYANSKRWGMSNESRWFNALEKEYADLFIDNDIGFAYEFIRIGEDDTDIEQETLGDPSYVLSVSRRVDCDWN